MVVLQDGAVFSAAGKWVDVDSETKTCYYPKKTKSQNPARMVLSKADLPAVISEDLWHIYKNEEFSILHYYGEIFVKLLFNVS